jgi:putative transcriptional regulator
MNSIMAKLTTKQLQKRDAGRDIGEELLQAVRDMKRGRAARTHNVETPVAAAARAKTGLTQAQFATLLGVSVRTLQEWEQGRREPSGSAQSLLLIALRHPEVLRELAA